jgi:pimeloyl-ACP methyl ester carboxylesterase
MRILHDFASAGSRAPTLAILLPGALQQPEHFADAGFIDVLRRRELPLDLALIDPGSHYVGDAIDDTFLQRLHDAVIRPARLEGYRRLWLGGISIGGFMALAYAERYPGLIDGLCLLAPYPGNRILTAEIKAAGGLHRWHPAHIPDNDVERRVWTWLKAGRPQPAVAGTYFGYGCEDRFAAGQQLMAQAFEERCMDIITGGHDWPVWRQLWENFLDRAESGIGHEIMDTLK